MKVCQLLPRIPRRFLLFVLLFSSVELFSACSEAVLGAGQQQSEAIAFRTIGKGSLRADDIPPQQIVFLSKESWRLFWKQYGLEETPAIDFTDDMVVAIFLGEKPNAGYNLEIQKVALRAAGGAEVEFMEYLPNPDSEYAAVLVYPHDVVIFQRVEGEILFQGAQSRRD